MFKLLVRKFIKNYRNFKDKNVRTSYEVLSGVVGILCNLLLFASKLIFGLAVNSIAVISDAFNNLGDIGSSLVAIFGARLSNTPPDKEHPYGHGRFEYVASLAVAFIIFGVGIQLIKTSFDKIIHPTFMEFNIGTFAILAVSILIKLWMYSYNRYINNTIDASINRATAWDSMSDVLATSAVVAGGIIGRYVSIPVDGILGMVISLFIIYTGFRIAKDSVNLILGSSPDPDIMKKINDFVLNGKKVVGAHDLVIHDYGPGRCVASVHAEVSDDTDLIEAHSEVDEIEQCIEKELGINIVIHIDPVNGKSPENPQN